MAITVAQIETVLAEMERFKRTAHAARKRLENEIAEADYLPDRVKARETHVSPGSRETGTLRRASHDLSRALEDLRRPR